MGRFTTSDGISLHYEEAGAGPAVLALSGLTRNSGDFDYIAPHLRDVRLIRMDYRGRGRSDRADHATYTIPVEARDALELLDHLGLDRAAILGTSRGGLIAMTIAALAKPRLSGACLVDIGPDLAAKGLDAIMGYLGLRPRSATLEEAAAERATLAGGFEGVPRSRWLEEARRNYTETPGGLELRYDARLRDAVEASWSQPAVDLWPLFDALENLPLALIRGANSDLLSRETAAEMQHRRPDMIFADVPGRGHVPFLDEPEAIAAIRAWTALLP